MLNSDRFPALPAGEGRDVCDRTTTIEIDPQSRPSNEAARQWLAADAQKCRGALGVDLGAGKLRNRPAFKTQRYVAVDTNERALQQGRELYPDAETVVSTLEDYDMPRDIALAMCFLVLMNKYFDKDFVVPFIERTIEHLAPGGSFLFNLGRQNLAARPAIDRIVHQRFASVRIIEYGRCHFPLPFGGAAAARFLSRHPSLCRPAHPSRRLSYYGCLGRL